MRLTRNYVALIFLFFHPSCLLSSFSILSLSFLVFFHSLFVVSLFSSFFFQQIEHGKMSTFAVRAAIDGEDSVERAKLLWPRIRRYSNFAIDDILCLRPRKFITIFSSWERGGNKAMSASRGNIVIVHRAKMSVLRIRLMRGKSKYQCNCDLCFHFSWVEFFLFCQELWKLNLPFF